MRHLLLNIFTLLLMFGLAYSDEEVANLWGISFSTVSQDKAGPIIILPGLPADISGLKTGDVLTQIDGKKFTTVREVVNIILNMPAKIFKVTII